MLYDYKSAYNLIENANNILLTTHTDPDGDALGSLCAFTDLFEKNNKKYKALVDDINDTYHFLPGIHNITIHNGTINISDFDLIITNDFSELSRSCIKEDLEEAIRNRTKIINFDHHQFNDRFGTINIVEEHSSSTTNILFKFFEINNIDISRNMATCLLAGILTDTSNLSNSATTLESIDIVSKLLLKGARFYRINQNTIFNKDLITMKLWGILLRRLKTNTKLNIAYTVITKEDFKKYNLTPESIEGLSNYLSQITGVNAILVLKENGEGLIRGSMRSIADNVDVSKLARAMGGGGHKKAAGFSVKGQLIKTENGWKVE